MTAKEYIESLGMFSLAPTLDRIKAVLKKLGNPEDAFCAVHIAGTNGKGSVCAMVSEALIASGKRVGRFVSPHILEFNERISVNGKNISDADLSRLTKKVQETGIALTEFEFITAVCFCYFKEQKIDIAVVETGLGGRLDATNSLSKKSLAIITEIGLDHTAILGDTIEEIAKEKCGIIKNCPTVTTPYQKQAAMQVIKEHSSKLTVSDLSLLSVEKSDIYGNRFTYDKVEFETLMAGKYQIENALVAIAALRRLGVDDRYIKAGLSSAFMPARLQVVSKDPTVVIDGAHNPDGAKVLAEFLKDFKSAVAIIGVMKDKEYETVLEKTLPFFEKAICVTPNKAGRALDGKELLKSACRFTDAVYRKDLKSALDLALSYNKPVFVFGSLYLAKDMLKLFKF